MSRSSLLAVGVADAVRAGDRNVPRDHDRRAQGADGSEGRPRASTCAIRQSFAKGRIPGAVNVDYTQVLKQAEQFAGEKRTIVTYCACANEMTAARASVDLAAKGIPGAKALKGGWDEWVSRGEKIEK